MPSEGNGLLAVLLITGSRPGPKLVFHWPCAPSERHEPSDNAHAGDALESGPENLTGDGLEAESGSQKRRGGDQSKTILGYSIDGLEKLLSPGRWSDRKKFEVCLDGVTFLGHPVFAREDGTWSKSSQQRERASREATSTELSGQHSRDQSPTISRTAPSSVLITATPARTVPTFTHAESFDSHGDLSLATSMNSTSTASAVAAEQMNMFHVVFAITSDSKLSPMDLYQSIAKPLSKELHYCQQQSSFVAAESRNLLAMMTNGRMDTSSNAETWAQMASSSKLASALKEVYERIAMGETANVRLNEIAISLQLPLVGSDHAVEISPHHGLLLLEEKDTLLRDLAHADPSPLVPFIQGHTPTKSLQKLAARLSVPLADILHVVRHMLKWRKAKLIAPLHPRNTYVVSSDAPIDQLSKHSTQYARSFAGLPSLPQILRILSGRPIRYGMLISSKDHREMYMALLAWLARHGFVSQLKTFAWLRSSGDGSGAKTQPAVQRRTRPESGQSLLSPQLRPTADDDAVSVGSHQTTIIRTGSLQEASQDSENVATLVPEPLKPMEEEEVMLTRIKDKIVDSDLKDRFGSLLRYFDGQHALEDIAAREGLKRAQVEAWINELDATGSLVTYRSV